MKINTITIDFEANYPYSLISDMIDRLQQQVDLKKITITDAKGKKHELTPTIAKRVVDDQEVEVNVIFKE